MDFEKQIQQRYRELPTQLLSLIDANTHEVVIREIVAQHGLTPEQTVRLSEEVLLVLLLFLPIKGLAERLEDSLEVGSERAVAITDYLILELFNLEEELFQETELLFAQNNKDISHADLAAIPAMNSVAEGSSTPHGYGAGLLEAEPTHQSAQETILQPTSNTDEDSSTAKNGSQ